MTNAVNVTTIQFTGNAVTDQKLRLLVQDIQAAERAVNTLLNSVATLQAAQNTEAVTQLLANPNLAPGFEVTGLTPGAVLLALTATSAAFKKLTLAMLAGVVLSAPANGQLLTFVDGTWINANAPSLAGITGGQNIGSGADLYAGIAGGSLLAFKSIQGDGSTIQITPTADTLTLSYIGGAIVGPQGAQGVPGMDGDAGEDAQIIPGQAGAPGAPGGMGPPGWDGADGEDLLMIPGAPGQQGIQGIPGSGGSGSGASGFEILFLEASTEEQWPQGYNTLPPAAAGATGATGPVGPAVFLEADPGEEGFFIPGPPGNQGPQGLSLQGPAGPAVFLEADVGEQGDWGPPGQGLPGPAGAAGTPGTFGVLMLTDADPGDDGWPGAPGAPGTPGTPGAAGIGGIGPPGLDGDPGDDGMPIPGNQGIQGIQGLPGQAAYIMLVDDTPGEDSYIPGPPGNTGATGAAGAPGSGGVSGGWEILYHEITLEEQWPQGINTPAAQVVSLGATQVGFGSASGVLSGSSSFTWNNTSLTLTLGTATAGPTIIAAPLSGTPVSFLIQGATGTTSFTPGPMNVQGGWGAPAGGAGGPVNITGGVSFPGQIGSGGSVNITGGAGGGDNFRDGGQVLIAGGQGTNSGGTIFITGGKALVAGNPGGSVVVSTGVSGSAPSVPPTITFLVGVTTISLAYTINQFGALGTGTSPSYGSAGQVLTSAGSSAVPTWQTPSVTPATVIPNLGAWLLAEEIYDEDQWPQGVPSNDGPKVFIGPVTIDGPLTVAPNDVLARGVAICKRATAIETRTSTTTLSNSTQLTYAVPAAGTYAFELVAYVYSTTAVTDGITANMNYSGSFTAVGSYYGGYIINTGGLTAIQNEEISAAVTTANTQMTSVLLGINSAQPSSYHIRGNLLATSAGTLAFSFAESVSGVDTCNLGVGSYLTITQLS